MSGILVVEGTAWTWLLSTPQPYCLGPHALAWDLPGRASLSPAHLNFGPDLPKPKGTCGPTVMKSLNVLVLPLLCTHAHPLPTSGTTNGDKALDNRCGERRAITVAGRAHTDPVSTQPPLPLSTTWFCVGPTFAISLSPLAPARQRAQAAALLTLRPPLADCTGQGAAWLLSHICGGQKAGHRGWPGPSVQLASGAEESTGWAPFMGEPRGVGVP